MRSLRLALAAFLFTILASPAFAQQGAGAESSGPPYGYGNMMMWNGPWGTSWNWHPGFFFGPLFMLLMLAGLVFFFYLFGRIFMFGVHGHGPGMFHACGYRRGHGAAIEILAERFAKGEIDKAEFEEKRKLLGG